MRNTLPKQVAMSNGKPDSEDLAESMNAAIAAKYVKGKFLGAGTFANVFLAHARDEPTKLFAIKKFKVQATQQEEGIDVSSIREIKYLRELSHPSIVALYDVFTTKDQDINMVIEFLPCGDLEVLIAAKDSIPYGPADIKAWMGMMGRAIYFCHQNFVLHRDIKPNNFLIAADGEIKLADFGLARAFAGPYANMTRQVITIWYRPPELLYGARHYSGAVDIWAMGMVFAQLVMRTVYAGALFQNQEEAGRREGEIAQLDVICEAVGTPTEKVWPGVSKLPNYIESEKQIPVRGKEHYARMFPTVGSEGQDLLMAMLTLDPRKRISARGMLEHGWWRKSPRPTEKENLPRAGGGVKEMGESVAKAPGRVEEEGKFRDVAKKLDFGGKR